MKINCHLLSLQTLTETYGNSGTKTNKRRYKGKKNRKITDVLVKLGGQIILYVYEFLSWIWTLFSRSSFN